MTEIEAVDWWPEERRAARVPDLATVSDWAARHRVLDAEHCAKPGPWQNDETPYLVGIMDAFGDRRVRELTLMGGTQWGKTECSINCLLWTIEQNSRPTMFVMPTEEDVLSFARSRLKAAIRECDVVRERLDSSLRSDWKVSRPEIPFEDMTLFLAWATSPSRLASRSIGTLFFDEVDKYPEFSGKEADPISLGRERLRWWHDSKLVRSSTPTVESGYIWTAWQESDRRWFHVPCPRCGHFQRLRWSWESIRWPKECRNPAQIENERLAWLVCEKCQHRIPDDGLAKRRMMLDGVWCPEGNVVRPDGNVRGPVRMDLPHQGYHVNALYSPALSWSAVAAQWLRSKDDVGARMNFQNSWVGWPWIHAEASVGPELLRQRQTQERERQVPTDCIALTAGVDVQEDELYVEICAHQPNEREHTVAAIRLGRDLQALWSLIVEGSWSDQTGKVHKVALCLIDSGYRTDEVYRFCYLQPEIFRPIKGQARRVAPYSATKVERDWLGRAGGMQLWHLDTGYYKGRQLRLFQNDVGTVASWTVHAEPHDEHLAHLCSERQTLKVNRKGGGGYVRVWEKKPGAGGNHWWDARVYASAAGDMLGCYAVREAPVESRPSSQDVGPAEHQVAEVVADVRNRGRSPAAQRRGWMSRRRGS